LSRTILTRRVDIGHIPPDGVTITADADIRTALAEEYGLVELKGLTATATLTPGSRGSVTVEGRVVADIVQTCVVSLAPVPQHIDETFTVRFVRPADAPPPLKPGLEIVVDPDAEDPPEVLDGPSVDVGAIVEETFALAMDPYPRAPGAALPAEPADGPVREDSPFVALAALAKGATKKP